MDLRNKLVVGFFYFVNYFYYSRVRIFGVPFYFLFRFIVYWILGTDLHYKTKISTGLKIYHGIALVVNPNCVIGKNVILRHNVTIGNLVKDNMVSGCPVIGDNVEVGCGAVILGDITIGNNVKVYANSIITKSVPNNSICYGYNQVKVVG